MDVIAKFAGMQPGIMKTLVTYLAPIVLGTIAKQFTGRPDAAGVSRLFSEQAANISGALPRGLSLPSLALGAVSGGRPSEPARHGGSPEPAAAGMPGWLLPLLVLAAGALGFYLWNEGRKKAAEQVVAAREDVMKEGPITLDRTEVVRQEGKKLIDEVAETISIDPKFLEAGKVAGTLFTDLTKILGGVTDEAGAKAALPQLEKLSPMLTRLEEETAGLPADEKPAFAKVIADNLGLLGRIIEKVMAIPGVKDVLGPVVTPMVETLTKLSK